MEKAHGATHVEIVNGTDVSNAGVVEKPKPSITQAKVFLPVQKTPVQVPPTQTTLFGKPAIVPSPLIALPEKKPEQQTVARDIEKPLVEEKKESISSPTKPIITPKPRLDPVPIANAILDETVDEFVHKVLRTVVFERRHRQALVDKVANDQAFTILAELVQKEIMIETRKELHFSLLKAQISSIMQQDVLAEIVHGITMKLSQDSIAEAVHERQYKFQSFRWWRRRRDSVVERRRKEEEKREKIRDAMRSIPMLMVSPRAKPAVRKLDLPDLQNLRPNSHRWASLFDQVRLFSFRDSAITWKD